MQWNSNRDRLLVLPPELRELCMMPLTTVEKCRAGQVCSAWHNSISCCPSLWADVDLNDRSIALAAILPRSARLAIRVAFAVSSNSELEGASSALGPHSHRLQCLRIRFTNRSPLGFPATVPPFDYPAPLLREVIFGSHVWPGQHPLYSIAPGVFNGMAPKLMSVTLHDVCLPATCPALANVSYASISGQRTRGLEHVFTVFPTVRLLKLANFIDGTILPRIPPSHPIREVRLCGLIPSVAQIVDTGYLDLYRLYIDTQDELSELGEFSRGFSASSDSTLEIDALGRAELILRRAGGREATLAAFVPFLEETRDALRDGTFSDIAHLVLPLHPHGAGAAAGPLLQGRIALPRLLSLQIRAGDAQHCFSLLDPAMQRGVIVAPLLARLEFTSNSTSATTQLRADRVAHFIETTLDLGGRPSLELVIDTAHGVRLECGSDAVEEMTRLRSCIGSLRM
ncbi:hypothetical protein AURDEDRAFT_166553 [Auricularia subglabra TFB-10046 SS5]|nr:hypothetical protein AURDEDRAFT_166553 [Auricularia subglabra TFB-10046 SS5]